MTGDADLQIKTYLSKQVHFDKNIMVDLTDGEGEYYLVCLSPSSRWLLLTLASFYAEYYNRWENFSGQREIDQLTAETLEGLICPMACATDIQDITASLQSINVTLQQIRDSLGGVTADIDERLVEIETTAVALTTAVEEIPSLIDILEPILSGVGVILGAPPLPGNGA